MHEMSIAMSLIEQVEEIAKKNNLDRIGQIELETGTLRGVIPEVMQAAFEQAKEGTVAQEAQLMIVDVHPVAQCNRCDLKFEPEINNFLCPKCSVADVRILQGDEIILKSIVSNNKETEGRS